MADEKDYNIPMEEAEDWRKPVDFDVPRSTVEREEELEEQPLAGPPEEDDVVGDVEGDVEDEQEDEHPTEEEHKADAEQSSTEDTEPSDPLAKFKREDGTIDYEKLTKAYNEIERAKSRLGYQLGETRQQLDELLRQQISSDANDEEFDEDAFYNNPREVIKKEVDREMAPYRQREQEEKINQFAQRFHSELADINTDDFYDWAHSSNYRRKLYQKADSRSADDATMDAAEELLIAWREHKQSRPVENPKPNGATPSQPTQPKPEQVSPHIAHSERGHAGASLDGDTSQKTWSYKEIVNIKVKNPAKARKLAKEWDKAFAEGRVIKP